MLISTNPGSARMYSLCVESTLLKHLTHQQGRLHIYQWPERCLNDFRRTDFLFVLCRSGSSHHSQNESPGRKSENNYRGKCLLRCLQRDVCVCVCTTLMSHVFVSEEVRPATSIYCTPTACRRGGDGGGNAALQTLQGIPLLGCSEAAL